jgi:catalase
MAMRNPVGRVNYEPNSQKVGPRKSSERGFRSFAEAVDGPKVRLRRKALPTTTAGSGCFSSARPIRSSVASRWR